MQRIFSLVAILVASGWVFGQDNQPPGTGVSIKMGFVDTLQVLQGTDEGKQEIGKVEQFVAQKQKEMETRSTELEKLREQYANQQRTLNPETRAEMEREIQEKDRQLKRFQEDTQLEIDRKRNELLGKMSDKIQKVISQYAEQNKFGVIFLRDQTQTYVAPALDITADIIKLYNQQFAIPVTAPATTQPAPPAPPPQKPPVG